MKKTLQRKLAGSISLSPELNRIALQSRKSWDEVSAILKQPAKKSKNSANNIKK